MSTTQHFNQVVLTIHVWKGWERERLRARIQVLYTTSSKTLYSIFDAWDDVIKGSPHPKLNGYQQPIPGGACGAKRLGAFVQTPVSEAILKVTTPYGFAMAIPSLS